MKINLKIWALALCLTCVAGACSDDDDNEAKSEDSCMADDFELEETAVEDFTSSESIIVTFDITNTSSTDYSISEGSTAVYTTMNVTTTDGTTYETNQILALTALSAGATGTVSVLGEYGAGKTYSSYELELNCP